MNIIKFGRIYCPRVRMIGVRIIEAQLYNTCVYHNQVALLVHSSSSKSVVRTRLLQPTADWTVAKVCRDLWYTRHAFLIQGHI